MNASNVVPAATSSNIGTIVLVVVLLVIMYAVYRFVYVGQEPTFTQFLKGEADARKPVHTKGQVPPIYTGGDFTLSFWIYVDDWDYRVSKYKFLFTLGPDAQTANTRNTLVGLLTPYKNGMLVRANTTTPGATPAPGSAPPSGSATPDITITQNLVNLLNQQTSMSMFETTLDQPCDVKDMPLQRWVNVTIVSSGRVLDVYMDGKLARSCVLDNVVHVPRAALKLTLGGSGGFGGRYANVQMWGQQLTPDIIYGIYQSGPTSANYNIFANLAKYLNIDVDFSGGSSCSSSSSGSGIFASFESDIGHYYNTLSGDVKTDYSKMMARF